MLNNYLSEIVAAIAILTILAVYFIIKKATAQKNNSIEEITSETQAIEDIYDTTEDQIREDQISKNKVQKKDINSSAIKLKKASILKRDVPSHGKISKDNFKEFAGKRILVAEDNLINQKVLSGLLAGSGIELVMASDGQEALDILEDDKDFAIILMDANMPRVDGFEATRRIRQNKKYDKIVVVALSGDTAPDDIKKMTEAGMQEHLEKPLRIGSLYDILYAYTGKQETHNREESAEAVTTKELNRDKGLNICGGDETFYLEILNEFVKEYANSSNRLRELIYNHNIIEADKLLLDIVGISANIGADNLKYIAGRLKEAIHDLEEKNYITLIEEYSNHLQSLLNDIQDYKNL